MNRGILPKLGLVFYLVCLMLPIYWLINMSLRSNEDIMSGLAIWPRHPSLVIYYGILHDATWVHGFLVSMTCVVVNGEISVTAAVPAAYAVSRFRFIGDEHLFFWLLTNLRAAAAVFALLF